MRRKTKDRARGKWDAIIAQFIGEPALTRKHGPCPICGGRDRYRYDNKENNGDWYCNVCGPGDGLRLLSESLGISFAEAAKRVDQIVGSIDSKPFKPPADNINHRRKVMNTLWSQATGDHIWRDYLSSRGISRRTLDTTTDIRGHAQVPYRNDDGSMQTVPAMLALIRNSSGEPASIHRTYLWDREYKHREKKIMPTISSTSGGYVQLAPVNDKLVLAEGIETALSLMCATGIPAWACISAHNLKQFDSVPERVSQVFICADNDATFVGQAAAFCCAERMKVKRHKALVQVLMPTVQGWDINDWWSRGGGPVAYKDRGIETKGLDSWLS